MIEGIKEAFSVGGTANKVLLVFIVIVLIATGVMTCLVYFVNPSSSQYAAITQTTSDITSEIPSETTA